MSRRRSASIVGAVSVAAFLRAALVHDDRWIHVPPGLDFHDQIWAPVRGLLAGFDPYTLTGGYARQFDAPLPAAPHAPSTLVLAAPLALLPPHVARLSWVALSIVGVWVATFMLTRRAWAALSVGALTLLLPPGELMLALGQLTVLPLLGLAMLLRYPGRLPGVIGVLLLAAVPQTGIPLCIVLAFTRLRPTIMRGAVATVALSIPVVIAAVGAERGVAPFARHLRGALRRTGPTSFRVDMSQNHMLVAILLFLAVLAGLCFAVHRWGPAPWLVVITATVATFTIYHQRYDIALLVGVVAVLAASGTPRSAQDN
jgi:hypothetical protein